jgi:hypothetical protein
MSVALPEPRRFRVHASHIARHHARVTLEPTSEAAVVSYIEGLPFAIDDRVEISIIVRDIDTGHEHCFRVNLDTGDAAPCAEGDVCCPITLAWSWVGSG